MTDIQQREAAKQFASYWKERGYEKGKANRFGFPCFERFME